MTPSRILVVEDQAIVAMDVAERLGRLGYVAVGPAPEGESAMQLVASASVDLVLMDIHLGAGRDGIDVADEIRNRFGTPVVFLTAFAEDATLERVTSVEPYALIVKPFDDRDLKGAIEVALVKHRAARALRASEQRYRTLVELSPSAIRVFKGSRCVFANDQAAWFRGLTRGTDLLGQAVGDGVPDADRQVLEGKVRDAEAGVPPTTFQHRTLAADGSERWCESIAVPVEYDDGPAVMVMATDITERKQAEWDRDRLHAQLVQAQKMESVGRLAGGVAHDFNNMLGVIIGHVEMAMMQADEGTSLSRDLEEIRLAATRSADLTKQLLAFARRQIVSPKVIDLNETISGLLRMMRRIIGEDIDLVWRPGRGLWTVRMDPTQVDQILVNLAVNARDAISGQGCITIETENVELAETLAGRRAQVPPGSYVTLRFTDSGTGMDEATVEHLFEPFFTTKAVGKGTGLGLATIYGIVAQNEGFVDVVSAPGLGTSFVIHLARAERMGEDDADVVPVPVRGGNEAILIVEDEAAILNLGRDMLERRGYRVFTARGPDDAIAFVRTHVGLLDLVLTDIIMPGMNGHALSEQLLGIDAGLRFLFMSGYTFDTIADHGVLESGTHFIQKPFSLRSLTDTVRRLLDEPAPTSL